MVYAIIILPFKEKANRLESIQELARVVGNVF